MNKLSKTQQAEFDKALAALVDAKDALEAGIARFNSDLETSFAQHVQPAVEAYNSAVQEAEALRQDIANEAEAYYDDRSEKWQESDKGQAFSEFKDQWEQELEELELEQPDELEEPSFDALDNFQELPVEVGGF